MGGGNFAPGCESEVEEAARPICIARGFSNPDQVRYHTPNLVYLDFPHKEAARLFANACSKNFQVGNRWCRVVRNSHHQRYDSAGNILQIPDKPPDHLLVRHIGDLKEDMIMEAFKALVPT